MTFNAIAAWLRKTRWWATGAAILMAFALDAFAGLSGVMSVSLPVVGVLFWWIPGLETLIINFRRGLNGR